MRQAHTLGNGVTDEMEGGRGVKGSETLQFQFPELISQRACHPMFNSRIGVDLVAAQ